jgi:hypothetical protein
MGQPLRPPQSGHSSAGIPWVLPLVPHRLPTLRQRIHRPGKKPSGVSAFVGVKGEDIRWSRLPNAPGQASRGVCKFAGRPPACPAGSRTHPVPVSHTQPYSVHAQSILSPHEGPRSVHVCGHVRGSTCPGTLWSPWRSTSNGVAKGMVERAGGRVGR